MLIKSLSRCLEAAATSSPLLQVQHAEDKLEMLEHELKLTYLQQDLVQLGQHSQKRRILRVATGKEAQLGIACLCQFRVCWLGGARCRKESQAGPSQFLLEVSGSLFAWSEPEGP